MDDGIVGANENRGETKKESERKREQHTSHREKASSPGNVCFVELLHAACK